MITNIIKNIIKDIPSVANSTIIFLVRIKIMVNLPLL